MGGIWSDAPKAASRAMRILATVELMTVRVTLQKAFGILNIFASPVEDFSGAFAATACASGGFFHDGFPS